MWNPRQSFLLSALTLSISACAVAGGETEDVVSVQDPLVETKHVGVTDMTILYPLPENTLQETVDDLLAPSSEGERGELLPPDIFDQLAATPTPPMMLPDGSTVPPRNSTLLSWRSDGLASLRVVGVRLDPCFGETNLAASSCVNTIRMTAQFISSTPGDNSADASVGIHLFYSITRPEFVALSKSMLALRRKAGLPLQKGFQNTYRPSNKSWAGHGVHPTLAVEGLRGTYATSLRDLLLQYAGGQNLTQVAFCVQDRGPRVPQYYGSDQLLDNRWVFGRFEVRTGSLYPLDIPSLNYTGLQTVDSASSATVATPAVPGAPRDVVTVNPAILTVDRYLDIFNVNKRPIPFDPRVSHTSAVKFLNPKSYTARTADCVSCHMAEAALARSGTLHVPAPTNPAAFKSSTYRLNASPLAASPFRMFGYGPGPLVGQRVVNETAVVLDYVNGSLLR